MTARRRPGPSESATCVTEFADGETFRMTTALGAWDHALALARAAWQSRRRTEAEPPPVASCHFERDGVIIARRPEESAVKKKTPPPEMTDEERATLLSALGRMKFVFAKTLADIPHQWVSRRQNAEADYVFLFQCWKKFAIWGTWTGPNGRTNKYRYLFPGDGFRYWAMTSGVKFSTIINRTRIENPEEYYAEDIKRAEAAGYIERTKDGVYIRKAKR